MCETNEKMSRPRILAGRQLLSCQRITKKARPINENVASADAGGASAFNVRRLVRPTVTAERDELKPAARGH